MIRVVLVGGQPVGRRRLRMMLEDDTDISVAGEAASGPGLAEAVRACRPDVVLVDVRMSGDDGIAATRALAYGPDRLPVVIMNALDLDEYLFRVLEAGAAGFLLEGAATDELVGTLRAAAHGYALVSPTVIRRVLAEFARRADTTRCDEKDISLLTARELEIVQALGAGQSNADIARTLHVETGTVKAHLSRITTKLDVHGRVPLVIWAFRHGLLS